VQGSLAAAADLTMFQNGPSPGPVRHQIG
jgi:hypothetical protein